MSSAKSVSSALTPLREFTAASSTVFTKVPREKSTTSISMAHTALAGWSALSSCATQASGPTEAQAYLHSIELQLSPHTAAEPPHATADASAMPLVQRSQGTKQPTVGALLPSDV